MHQTVLLQMPGGPGASQLLLLLAFGVIFFFFFIRPQQKKQKKQKQFIADLQKGNHVITTGGLHGKVVSVEENTVHIEIDKGTKIKVEKGSVSQELTDNIESGEKK